MKKLLAITIVFAFLCSLVILVYQIRQRFFPSEYKKEVIIYSLKNDLDPLWVAAMISVESSFNTTAISPSGAIGLMQVMPGTGYEVAKKIGINDFSSDSLRNPSVNLMIGCWYFRRLKIRYGNREKALIAYNAGPGNLDKWLTSGGSHGDVIKRAFPETRNHVRKVNKIYSILKFLNMFWNIF
ncbi:MAG: lytic transglycosylase domain-containing protein [Candidatus Theseobacter exili]|nr:lytic transglycosylase domain-containing protein [Candidatus Theseobacter exili]